MKIARRFLERMEIKERGKLRQRADDNSGEGIDGSSRYLFSG